MIPSCVQVLVAVSGIDAGRGRAALRAASARTWHQVVRDNLRTPYAANGGDRRESS